MWPNVVRHRGVQEPSPVLLGRVHGAWRHLATEIGQPCCQLGGRGPGRINAVARNVDGLLGFDEDERPGIDQDDEEEKEKEDLTKS